VNITRIDSDTLAIATLVAESEGITLQQAILDQLELFSL
jgi:antitoxin component of RelBE/YafQ-DinJ toxin-antitoxin module